MAADALATAIRAEAGLGHGVAEWHARSGDALRSILQSTHTAASPPLAGLSLVRPDLLAQVEERAAAAARDAASRHVAHLEGIAREYGAALGAFAGELARLRITLSRARPDVGDEPTTWRVVASLDARLVAYEGDCALLTHITSSLSTLAQPHEYHALLAALRLSPFLSEPGARAARSLLDAQGSTPTPTGTV
ncbi:hypothetical protein KFE25_006879 [Diacronema lutheri]|uniref:Uncharacterized protein n=1 Tax=Diacronema lutheri TaxID=2081491 RepID=A0A8J6CAN2_DIALT|nr:hypothetical protein KFE25_006879 [Diacronema lutheri]